jgi:hypothetical protein
MARELKVTATVEWPMVAGQQAMKIPLAVALTYEEAVAIENKYASPVTDEAVTLPMTTAKFLLVQCTGENASIKINGGGAIPITKTVGTTGGFAMVWSNDGAITALSVTLAAAPATVTILAFA